MTHSLLSTRLWLLSSRLISTIAKWMMLDHTKAAFTRLNNATFAQIIVISLETVTFLALLPAFLGILGLLMRLTSNSSAVFTFLVVVVLHLRSKDSPIDF